MIYTIGHTKNYLQYFDEQGIPQKKGKTKNYGGGSVWKTKEEAQQHCHFDYSVFGVDADWDKDTESIKGVTWHALLTDKPLIKLDE